MDEVQKAFEAWYRHRWWNFPDHYRKAEGYINHDVNTAWLAYRQGRVDERENNSKALSPE